MRSLPAFGKCVCSVYEASCYAQQAHGLLEKLIKENRDMTVRWEEDAAGHQVWRLARPPRVWHS